MADLRFEEFDRSAVITIQGGAIFGFSVLGQLSSLIVQHGIVPAAIAANSAGAIVATLYWAGYTPEDIRGLFAKLSEDKRLILLMGCGGNPKYSAKLLSSRYNRLSWLCSAVGRRLKPKNERSLRDWLCICTLDLISLPLHAWRLTDYYQRRGIFPGREFEQQIDRWLRDSPKLKPLSRNLPADGLLRFNHIKTLFTDFDTYFPPLLLTATNVAARKLVVFNSFEDTYGEVRIASAVRASAGFPWLFEPAVVAGAPEPGPYVDGGMITNYPAWIFSRDLRERLARNERYRAIATRPWLHIGLRVSWKKTPADAHDDSPRAFATGLKDLWLGGARTQLEDQFVPAAQSFEILQPEVETEGPENFLDLKAITPSLINRMFEKSEAFANKTLERISFRLPADSDVDTCLRKLVESIADLFRNPTNDTVKFRSNVFLAKSDRLELRYSFAMNGDPDQTMSLGFEEGLTGFVFVARSPHLCNLRKIGELATNPEINSSQLFGMSPSQHALVRSDRTFLASVPILDPATIFIKEIGKSPTVHRGEHFNIWPNPIDGAIFGVLNVDAAIDFAQLGLPDEPISWTDVKFRSTIALMQSASLEIGRLLSDSFGRKEAGEP